MRRKSFISAAGLAAAVLSAVLSVPAQGLFPLLSETGSYGRTIKEEPKSVEENYALAMYAMYTGDYDEAIRLFELLEDYGHSDQYVTYCRALQLIGAGDRESLIRGAGLLRLIPDIPGSADRIAEAEEKLARLNAQEELPTEEETSAPETEMPTEEPMTEGMTAPAFFEDISAGAHIFFGCYEQNGNEADGPEEIEWRVLTVEEGRILVISEYGLDCMPLHDQYAKVTWEECSLRKWLNGDFCETAFPGGEKDLILAIRNTTENHYAGGRGGSDTVDRVFLLSEAQAREYFDDDDARLLFPTRYAFDRGAEINAETGACRSWLRSPGPVNERFRCINDIGEVYGAFFVHSAGIAVRPAIWLGTRPVMNAGTGYVPFDGELSLETEIRNRIRPYNQADVGDYVEFGHYEQDGCSENGAEAIRWRVLARKGGKLLLISEYGLDAKPYFERWEGVTWERSDIRSWLNEDFCSAAFTGEERERIALTHVVNHDNAQFGTEGGNDTEDAIFLLSLEEAKSLFANDEARIGYATPYAEAKGAEAKSYYNYRSGWYLRSPGDKDRSAATVIVTGEVSESGSYVDSAVEMIRPACWISTAPVTE